MKILMVCLGNICRSPLAEGILAQKIKERKLDWIVDSCGTSGYHDGELPDSRSISTARKYNIDITHQRSRKINQRDIEEFDLIIAMDSSNFQDIQRLCKPHQSNKVKLLLNYLYPDQNRAVPDPYYHNNFDEVFHMIYDACEQLILSEIED